MSSKINELKIRKQTSGMTSAQLIELAEDAEGIAGALPLSLGSWDRRMAAAYRKLAAERAESVRLTIDPSGPSYLRGRFERKES